MTSKAFTAKSSAIRSAAKALDIPRKDVPTHAEIYQEADGWHWKELEQGYTMEDLQGVEEIERGEAQAAAKESHAEKRADDSAGEASLRQQKAASKSPEQVIAEAKPMRKDRPRFRRPGEKSVKCRRIWEMCDIAQADIDKGHLAKEHLRKVVLAMAKEEGLNPRMASQNIYCWKNRDE